MRFEKYFKVWETRDQQITLQQAIKIAKEELIVNLVYDPIGVGGPDSWWWCVAVLEVLQQEDLIREFEVVKRVPKSQTIPAKIGVTY